MLVFRFPLLKWNKKFQMKKVMIPKIMEVQDLKVGDIVRTSQGDLPISHIMKTQVVGNGKKYVKFAKNCLGYNVPDEDFLLQNHTLCALVFTEIQVSGGNHLDEYDNFVPIQVDAHHFIDKIPGITLVTEDFLITIILFLISMYLYRYTRARCVFASSKMYSMDYA